MALTKTGTDGIKDDAVTSAKIAAGNITSTELATDSVTGAKIAAGAINNANKIQDSIITGAKIGSGTITAGNIATNAVTDAKISSMAASKLTGDLPAISGANLTGLSGGVPTGCILLWSGAANAIPTGYALCDGNNSTPNLSGKFVVGYHASNGDYDVNDTGGAETVTLTEAQMPAHNHHGYITNDSTGTYNSFRGAGPGAGIGWISTSTRGSGNAHENRPPYFALCYIMKT